MITGIEKDREEKAVHAKDLQARRQEDSVMHLAQAFLPDDSLRVREETGSMSQLQITVLRVTLLPNRRVSLREGLSRAIRTDVPRMLSMQNAQSVLPKPANTAETVSSITKRPKRSSPALTKVSSRSLIPKLPRSSMIRISLLLS